MSARVRFWLGAFAAGVASGVLSPEDLFPAARVVAFGATFFGAGLIGEAVASARAGRKAWAAVGPQDTRPADGRVEIAPVAALRRKPNAHDPRFGRYVGHLPFAREGPASPADDPAQTPPLRGRVVIVSIFEGGDGRTWSEREIADAHVALRRAGEWIEREATRHAAPVNLEIADTYFMAEGNDPGEVTVSFAPEEDGVGPLEDGATTKALVRLSRAAAAMGFRDAVHLFDEVEGRVGADSTAWLLHPRRAGRSFAVPRDESGLDGVGVAVCYPREASFPEKLTGTARVDPVTVVHELLHLFGAADKYGQPLSAFAPRTVTAREVMRLSHTRLTRLRIDAATAREIGWNTSG